MALDIYYNKLCIQVILRFSKQHKLKILKELGNIRKISNLREETALRSVFLPEIKVYLVLSNSTRFPNFIPNIFLLIWTKLLPLEIRFESMTKTLLVGTFFLVGKYLLKVNQKKEAKKLSIEVCYNLFLLASYNFLFLY